MHAPTGSWLDKNKRNSEEPVLVFRKMAAGLKAVTGPDSAEATEITEWVKTEFTEKYWKLRSSDTRIQRRYR